MNHFSKTVGNFPVWKHMLFAMLLMLQQSSNAGAFPQASLSQPDGNGIFCIKASLHLAPGIPQLSAKEHRVEGEKDVFVFSISFLDDPVDLFLNKLKNIHDPRGTSIGPSFLLFATDKTQKTLTIGVAKGTITQEKLLQYLQQCLNNEFRTH